MIMRKLSKNFISCVEIEFGEGDEGDEKNLDSLLLERNKLLTKELAEHRSEHENLVNKIQSLEENLSYFQAA